MHWEQVSTEKILVLDSAGKEIESQLLPLSNATLNIKRHYVNACPGKASGEGLKYWLAFKVSVPPLGFSTYTVRRTNQIG